MMMIFRFYHHTTIDLIPVSWEELLDSSYLANFSDRSNHDGVVQRYQDYE